MRAPVEKREIKYRNEMLNKIINDSQLKRQRVNITKIPNIPDTVIIK